MVSEQCILVTSANEVIFSPVSVCLSVCYKDSSKTTDHMYMIFYRMAGHNPGLHSLGASGYPCINTSCIFISISHGKETRKACCLLFHNIDTYAIFQGLSALHVQTVRYGHHDIGLFLCDS